MYSSWLLNQYARYGLSAGDAVGHVSAWEQDYLADIPAPRASAVKPVQSEVDAAMEREWGTRSHNYIDGPSHGEFALGTCIAAMCVKLLLRSWWGLKNSLQHFPQCLYLKLSVLDETVGLHEFALMHTLSKISADWYRLCHGNESRWVAHVMLSSSAGSDPHSCCKPYDRLLCSWRMAAILIACHVITSRASACSSRKYCRHLWLHLHCCSMASSMWVCTESGKHC